MRHQNQNRALAAAAASALLALGGSVQAQGLEVRLSGLLTGPRGEFVLSAEEWRRYQEWKQREAAPPKQ